MDPMDPPLLHAGHPYPPTPTRSLDELQEGSQTLFHIGRFFDSHDILKDDLCAYWLNHTSVISVGLTLKCYRSSNHVKSKREADRLVTADSIRHEDRGFSSINAGCAYDIHYRYVQRNDKYGPVEITGGCHVHTCHDLLHKMN
jgi:hypothetical protein